MFYTLALQKEREMADKANAGKRLWEIQQQQKTGLCVGLDPQYDPEGVLNGEFYSQFATNGDDLWDIFAAVARIARTISSEPLVQRQQHADSLAFFTGLTCYYLRVVRAAWNCGIRVFKPQSASYEQFGLAGQVILAIL